MVDDEASARSGLEKLLRHVDYEVSSATGVAALEVAASFAPDVVVTDLKMPNTDGMTLRSRGHDERAGCPVASVSPSRSCVRPRALESFVSACGSSFRAIECVCPDGGAPSASG